MSTVYTALEIIGIISFSLSGAIMAIDRENDFFGVVFLSIITCFGGGMLRDIFIGNTPPIFFKSYLFVIVSVFVAVSAFIIASIFKKQYVENEKFVETVNNILDAAGLGVFVIAGAKICLDLGFSNPLLVIIMGMLSGTGGSMTRDIIMREVPYLLRKRIYMLAAIIGATLYYILWYFKVSDALAYPMAILLIFIIRMLATIFKWNMPRAITFSKLKDSGRDNRGANK